MNSTGIEKINLLSKKDIRRIMKVSQYQMKTQVFNDSVLSAMGMTRQEFRNIKAFSLEQSLYILNNILPHGNY